MVSMNGIIQPVVGSKMNYIFMANAFVQVQC